MTHFMPEDDREAAEMLRQVYDRLSRLEEQNTAETTPNVLRSVDEAVATTDAVSVSTSPVSAFVWDSSTWDSPDVWDGTQPHALDFAGGTDEVQVPSSDYLNLAGPYTDVAVTVRFKPDTVTPAAPQLLWEEGGGIRGYSMYVWDSKAWVGAWNLDDTQTSTAWETQLQSTTTLTAGETYHLALVQANATDTVSPDVMRLVLDGVQEATGDGASVYTHTGDITIGNGDDALTISDTREGFTGVIDEVRAYGDGLTEAQLADEAATGAFYSPLIARWPFDEGSGAIANDRAGDHDATIVGATWTDPLFPTE